ncbi:MAG: FAD-dependent oxidoreductase [Acidobacteria bacterium]|nr:FAD-dependent oxidoreductase [Acidobacteriota bacterium]
MASMRRRDILKLAGAAFLPGAEFGGSSNDAPFSSAGKAARIKKKVIVAGGGIGGLCCAYELMRRGHDVTVLEASGRTGGHVRTIRDPLADGLYVDGGAEHFTKPGYDLYWNYVKEFELTALPYPRREHMLRLIDGKMHTVEMLADPEVLKKLGFNQREVDHLSRQPWWSLPLLYYGPYLDSFKDEYRPFDAGLNHLDQMTPTDLLKKDGASDAAIRFIGGSDSSALHVVWHAALLKLRGVPLWPPHVFRLKGGNQKMTDAFASRLGERVRLGCPVIEIEHGATGVTVRYREFGREKTIDGDFLVSSMSLVMLRQVPVKPNWPDAKKYVIENFPYYTASRPVFQSRTPFWKREGISPNMEFGEASLSHVWRMADEVETHRGLLVGTAQGLTSADDALATFRKFYPGKSDDIEQTLVIDWASDPWAMACEPINYAPGELPKFWPLVIEPHGRIHFVGAYADNLGWGMEAATRSANRVARAIHEA